jgi:hypothetical protein
VKLTDAQKQNMYAMRSAGITLQEIAKAYGRSTPGISKLLKEAGVRRPYLRHAPTYGADNEVVTALVENRLNAVAAVLKPHLQELKALSEKFIKAQVAALEALSNGLMATTGSAMSKSRGKEPDSQERDRILGLSGPTIDALMAAKCKKGAK